MRSVTTSGTYLEYFELLKVISRSHAAHSLSVTSAEKKRDRFVMETNNSSLVDVEK